MEQREGAQHEVARIECAAVTEEAVMVLVQPGELELALGVGTLGVVVRLLRQRTRVAEVVGRHHHLLLQPVDSRDHAAEQRGRVPPYLVPP